MCLLTGFPDLSCINHTHNTLSIILSFRFFLKKIVEQELKEIRVQIPRLL